MCLLKVKPRNLSRAETWAGHRVCTQELAHSRCITVAALMGRELSETVSGIVDQIEAYAQGGGT